MMDIRKLWPRLPRSLQRGLLHGSVGPLHLAGLAAEALQAAGEDPALTPLGVDLLLAAWGGGNFLDGALAGQVAALAARVPGVDPALADLAAAASRAWQPPAKAPLVQRLLERRDLERLEAVLRRHLQDEPGNLFWIRQAVGIGLYEGRHGLVEAALAGLPPELGVVARAVALELAAVQGEWDQVLAAAPAVPGPMARLLEALAATRVRGLEGSRQPWQRLLAAAPWCVQGVLVLHDLVEGLDAARAVPEAPGVVALYTLDKPEDLDRTLGSLAASRLFGAAIWVLDNGCAAPAKAVMARWQERLGPALRVIVLPVNVGAPAARNWLRAEFLRAGLPWLVYADDDVDLPPDWLERLWAARQRLPEAGVWGCRVVDARAPWVLQSVDLHLAPPREEGRRFTVSDLHHQTLDWGAFTYLRPCASVTGCVHLLDARAVAAEGEFDLRFSPSQYDDLDRDVRMLQAGRVAVYQGHLAVRHCKRSGSAASMTPASWANAMANLDKLHKKYPQETWDEFMEREAQALEEDFWPKLARVRAWLA